MKEPIIFILVIGLVALLVATGIKKFIATSVNNAPSSSLSFEDKQQVRSQQRTKQDKLKRDQEDLRRQYEQQMRDYKNR